MHEGSMGNYRAVTRQGKHSGCPTQDAKCLHSSVQQASVAYYPMMIEPRRQYCRFACMTLCV
jgi:hypothetical protein